MINEMNEYDFTIPCKGMSKCMIRGVCPPTTGKCTMIFRHIHTLHPKILDMVRRGYEDDEFL